MSEKYPIQPDKNGNINTTILKATEIYKTDKWWKIVALVDTYGKKQVQVFLWMKDARGRWQEKQKYSEKGLKEWDKVKAAFELYIKECQ